jgi:hypothetical protein
MLKENPGFREGNVTDSDFSPISRATEYRPPWSSVVNQGWHLQMARLGHQIVPISMDDTPNVPDATPSPSYDRSVCSPNGLAPKPDNHNILGHNKDTDNTPEGALQPLGGQSRPGERTQNEKRPVLKLCRSSGKILTTTRLPKILFSSFPPPAF